MPQILFLLAYLLWQAIGGKYWSPTGTIGWNSGLLFYDWSIVPQSQDPIKKEGWDYCRRGIS